MKYIRSEYEDERQRRRRLITTVKDSLRDVRNQLSMFNRRVGVNLDLKDVDMDCLDLINRHGPVSPSSLARQAGLHPATMTGILDRLERAGCVARERRSSDRRALAIRALRNRNTEVCRLLSGMNKAMDQICAGYDDSELELIADFLRRAAAAGQEATRELAED